MVINHGRFLLMTKSLLVDVVEIKTPITSSQGLTSDGRTTGHVRCNSNKITLENGTLTVE